MIVHSLTVGSAEENCYVFEGENHEAFVIDPGADARFILKFCSQSNIEIKKVLFTHGHYDHISAATEICAETGAKRYIHEADNEFLLNPQLLPNGGEYSVAEGYLPAAADGFLHDGDVISVGGISLTVAHTPGHSNGSCIFIEETDGTIFSGDTLFAGSIGRTDFYGGNMAEMKKSLEKITKLKGKYKVFPGHGESAELSRERQTNPYLNGDFQRKGF